MSDSGNGNSLCSSRKDDISSIETNIGHLEADPKSLSFTSLDMENQKDNEKSENHERIKNVLWLGFKILSALLYNAYIVYAVYFHKSQGIQLDWCGGLGFLLVMTGIVYLYLLCSHAVSPLLTKFNCQMKPPERLKRLWRHRYAKIAQAGLVLLIIVIFLILDTKNDRYRLVSAGGLVAIILIGFIFSKHRRRIIWRHVIWALTLQFIFALIILRWSLGRAFFECLGSKIDTFLEFTDTGSSFVFGYLVNQKPFIVNRLNSSVAKEVAQEINLSKAMGSVVVFKALSTVYFLSFVVSMLYYWGVLQWIVIRIGGLLQKTIGTTACESLNAAANIFMGQATAPFLIKPYLGQLTLSETHAVMTGGFATIAGTVLAAYVSFGVSASHLVSASVMSAPAALGFAKLFFPETEKSKTRSENIVIEPPKEANVVDAATQGASSAGLLVVSITAIVVAFIAFISFINSLFVFFGGLIGIEDFTFDNIMGKVFIPLAFVMGVEWEDCEKVARLIGIKMILNEFIAYQQLGVLIKLNELSKRSVMIATYALCGFANPGSIGVQLATLSSLAPHRKSDFSRVVLRAYISGNMACFLTACIAGTLYDISTFNVDDHAI